MNKIQIVNKEAGLVGEFLVQDQWIELEKGEQAVKDVVVAYRAGIRAGTASTKTRAMVRGGGAKPWRQKGTGRARAGSSRSPIWVGGGVAFGPHPRNFSKKVNKKVNKLALKRVFSEKLKTSNVLLIDNLDLSSHKTKDFAALLDKIGLKSKVLVLVKNCTENLFKATSNLPNVLLMRVDSVNVYQMLLCDDILLTEEAIKDFVSSYSSSKKGVDHV